MLKTSRKKEVKGNQERKKLKKSRKKEVKGN